MWSYKCAVEPVHMAAARRESMQTGAEGCISLTSLGTASSSQASPPKGSIVFKIALQAGLTKSLIH